MEKKVVYNLIIEVNIHNIYNISAWWPWVQQILWHGDKPYKVHKWLYLSYFVEKYDKNNQLVWAANDLSKVETLIYVWYLKFTAIISV